MHMPRVMLLYHTPSFHGSSSCCPTSGHRKLFLQRQNREMPCALWSMVRSALTKTQGVSHCCDSLSILQKSLHSITHCYSTSCRCMLLYYIVDSLDLTMPCHAVLWYKVTNRGIETSVQPSDWHLPTHYFLQVFHLTCLWQLDSKNYC